MSRALYGLRAPPRVVALIGGLHPQIKKKVRSALASILANPLAGKALKGELEGLRSFRVGRIRIIYRNAEGRVVELVAIGPRARIYAETYRMIARKRAPLDP